MDQPTHFDCRAAFARLEDYLDRELSAGDVRCIEEHLALCEVCAREFKFEAGILCALKQKLRCVSAPPDLLDRIRTAIERSRQL
ncbi:MAG TPA: zf-HC2 domain-containing protein [Gemmatimonadales bacterium]